MRIAPGSGSKAPDDTEIALVVDPQDCEPEGALTKHTRFRLTDNRRIGREKLRTYVARLKEAKRKELELLRERLL